MNKTEKKQFSKILCLQWAVDLRLLCFDDEKSDFGLVFLVDFIFKVEKVFEKFQKVLWFLLLTLYFQFLPIHQKIINIHLQN